MSQNSDSESGGSSPTSTAHSETQSGGTKQAGTSRKKANKVTKPRLTASQKNTNHKDAENKRRNAIRERFTDLSRMVPGAEGQERSEQVMLGKTTDYLREILEEQRRLETIAEQRGLPLSEKDKLRDDDYGGPAWRQVNMDTYNASKAKKTNSDGTGYDRQDSEP